MKYGNGNTPIIVPHYKTQIENLKLSFFILLIKWKLLIGIAVYPIVDWIFRSYLG